jgi:hypothetical protein
VTPRVKRTLISIGVWAGVFLVAQALVSIVASSATATLAALLAASVVHYRRARPRPFPPLPCRRERDTYL